MPQIIKYMSPIRLTIIALGALGFYGVSGISISHWTGESACPTIFSIPACYIIFVGYGLILLSMFLPSMKSLKVFLIGWIPVFVLALIGVLGEITSTLSCPANESGIPKCFFSGILSLIIGLLYWYFYKTRLNK